MRKGLYFCLIVALIWNLCACTVVSDKGNGTGLPIVESPTTEPVTQEVTTTSVPEATTSAHCPLYLPQYAPDQIWEYFEEIVLHMEYTDGTGDASLVQKWEAPIYYCIDGAPTDEDNAVLMDLFAQLNEIAGFPGIYPSSDWEPVNLTIHFLNADDFSAEFSETVNGEDAYGATQFWYYTETNEIHTANVGYRTDIDQTTRTSILLEEIVNMLGISDTVLREDSIVYQYSNDNTALSDVDWVILKLLYDPAIQCGMNGESCRKMIEELYY